MVVGIPLERYDQTLFSVAQEFDRTPHESFDAMSELGPDVLAYVMDNFGDDYVFDMAISYLQCQVFERLTFDQAAKIRHSASRIFYSNTHEAFDANPSNELSRKIKRSIWRWSLHDKSSHDVIAAYAAIRSFDLAIEEREFTLYY